MPLGHGAHQDRGPHGICESEQRRRTIGEHDLTHEGLKVDAVLGKTRDVPLARLSQYPVGQSLAAPVKRRHRKAARMEIARHLEIFFDELGTSLKDANRPPATQWRRPTREPDRDSV